MSKEEVYERLGRWTEEMFYSLEKTRLTKMQEQLLAYHSLCQNSLRQLSDCLSEQSPGELMRREQRKLRILSDDFELLRQSIGSKYKIYLRGCGNAGKSTLLNALLSLSEETGSKMGRLPTTFTIDTFSDELSVDRAEIRFIEKDGSAHTQSMSHAQAVHAAEEEELAFARSRAHCREKIDALCAEVYLQDERDKIAEDVYRRELLHTRIREVRWGIGENSFFHNCLLVDTPGLSQELRFTNMLEDIKSYEVDGIIWVISSETLSKQEVVDAYQEEMRLLEEVYRGSNVIAVINMYGTGAEYRLGSRLWRRVQKKAEKVCREQLGVKEVFCVNALLAYEGNCADDVNLLDESGLPALRKRINQMFSEKNSDDYLIEQLKRLDDFVDNFAREAERAAQALDDFVAEYQKREMGVKSTASACRSFLDGRKDELLRLRLAQIENRIDQYASEIDERFNSGMLSERFIEDAIIQPASLELEMRKLVEDCAKQIRDRFQSFRGDCVISLNRSQVYRKETLRLYDEALSGKYAVGRIAVCPATGLASAILSGVSGLFGSGSIVAGLFRSVARFFKSPQDTVKERVRQSLQSWSKDVNLDKLIESCQSQCMETLDRSMADACARYDHACSARDRLKNFTETRPHMQWRDITITELAGVVDDV